MGLSNLFASAHSQSGCSIMVEKPRQQEFERADHVSSAVRKVSSMVLPITKMGLPKSRNAIKVIVKLSWICWDAHLPKDSTFYQDEQQQPSQVHNHC